MSVNQRFSDFVNQVTVKEILLKTNLKQSALYRAKSGGGVTADTLEEIFNAYPNLNPEWLFFGIGKMWKIYEKLENNELIKMNDDNTIQVANGNGNKQIIGTTENEYLKKALADKENEIAFLRKLLLEKK